MAYILNLVLGCWLSGDDKDNDNTPGIFLNPEDLSQYQQLSELVEHWNSFKEQSWEDIHYPCRIEHFEVYNTLPTNWRICDETEIP